MALTSTDTAIVKITGSTRKAVIMVGDVDIARSVTGFTVSEVAREPASVTFTMLARRSEAGQLPGAVLPCSEDCRWCRDVGTGDRDLTHVVRVKVLARRIDLCLVD